MFGPIARSIRPDDFALMVRCATSGLVGVQCFIRTLNSAAAAQAAQLVHPTQQREDMQSGSQFGSDPRPPVLLSGVLIAAFVTLVKHVGFEDTFIQEAAAHPLAASGLVGALGRMLMEFCIQTGDRAEKRVQRAVDPVFHHGSVSVRCRIGAQIDTDRSHRQPVHLNRNAHGDCGQKAVLHGPSDLGRRVGRGAAGGVPGAAEARLPTK